METTNETTNISKQFINGLKEYNLTKDELINWKYCGGNEGSHYNYFKLSCPNDDMPEYTTECVCKHVIRENCYITNGEEILVLGNCCIKRFIPKSGRTCELCDEPHKNRIVNRCNACKIKRVIPKSGKTCELCNNPHQNRIVDRCNACRIGRCDECSKKCNPDYKLCYQCYFN